jgi:cytoskeletal protein CcmA (bactofilin family)
MFGRRNIPSTHDTTNLVQNTTGANATNMQNANVPRAPIMKENTMTNAPQQRTTDTQARMVAGRSTPARHENSGRNRMDDKDMRKLTVGRDITLSGEIAACDILVVEGKIEARLAEGRMLEITETGQFKGTVAIDNADIAGRFDGELTVHGRLTLRGSGRISGIIRYGELEVAAGGQVIGEVQVVNTAGNAKDMKNVADRMADMVEETAPRAHVA